MKISFSSLLVVIICTTNLCAQDCISNVDVSRYLADTSNLNQLDSLHQRQGSWVFNGALCRQWGWPNSSGEVFDSCEVCAVVQFKDGFIIDTTFLFNRKGELIVINIAFESENQPTEVGYYESGNKRYERYSKYMNPQQNLYTNATIMFLDSIPGCPFAKYLEDGAVIEYEHCEIALRTSTKYCNYYIKEVSEAGSKKIQYAVEKGKFKNERLYNGFIYYYNEHDSLLRTVKVSEGKHLNDSTLSFNQSYLDQLLNHYPRIDIDFSGTIENSEMKHFKNLLPVKSIEINKEVSFVEFPALPATFPGAEPALKIYLDKNKIYPPTAFDNKEEGIVYVSFIIEKDGSISSIEVLRGVSSAIDAEVIRLIKAMPDWHPARDHEKVVRSKYVLPVKFALP